VITMMKVLIFCLIALGATCFAKNNRRQYDGECAVPDFTGFCSAVVSDAPNHTVDGVVNDYVADLELLLGDVWSEFTDTLNEYSSKYDFDVCQDCLTALKQMFCASLVPSCGFLNCVAEAADEVEACVYDGENTNNTCATQCAAAEEFGASIQAVANCYLCESNCISAVILTTCKQYMMSQNMCAGLLSVCACDTNPADIDVVCQFFSDDGYTIPFPPGLSCTGTKNWCEAGNKRSTEQQPGVISPNKYVSFQAPQATGQENVASPLVSEDTEPPVAASSARMLTAGFVVAASLIALC